MAKRNDDEKKYVSSRDLSKLIADRAQLSAYQVDKVLAALSDEVVSQLKDGKMVKIRGLANVEPVFSPAHEVYSPHDQKKVMTKPKTKIRMRPAAAIRKEVE